jgi:hypothetical protein
MSKKWGNTKEKLLLAFKFEISQVLKSYFTEDSSQRKLVHKFQRDYTEYLNKDDLSIYAQKKFGSPKQKRHLSILSILMNELKTVIPDVTANIITDFLFRKTRNDVGILKFFNGSLQIKIPKFEDMKIPTIEDMHSFLSDDTPWDFQRASEEYLRKDLLPAIIATEIRVDKYTVCTILSLPQTVNKLEPHGLVLSIRKQDGSKDYPQWSNFGTIAVPIDESVCEIESHVTSLYELWKKKT